MGSKLKENLSNKYYQRRNLLTARPNLMKVLVEDGMDISIWERILKSACPDKQFDVMPYQEGMNKAQSKHLVIKAIAEKGGSSYIGCVDSDLDKFLERVNYPQGGLFYPAHYLFHTYVYSVENLFCLPSTLGDVYTTATSFKSGLDFVEFFKMVSQRIYPLVVMDLYLRSVGSKDVFNVNDWSHIFPGEKVVKQTMSGNAKSDIVTAIESNVSKYIKALGQADAFNVEGCKAFERQLSADFPYMNAENCILFVYGHAVFEFVKTIFEEQRKIDKAAEQQEIYGNRNMEQRVKDERVRAMENRQLDVNTALRSNFAFMQRGFSMYNSIVADLQQAL